MLSSRNVFHRSFSRIVRSLSAGASLSVRLKEPCTGSIISPSSCSLVELALGARRQFAQVWDPPSIVEASTVSTAFSYISVCSAT